MFKAAFYKGTHSGIPGVYNRIVRWWDRGIYSHCELIFSDGMSASSSFMDGGVRFKKIDYDPGKWDFVVLPDELETDARAWFTKNEGKAYDVMGNIRFLLGFLRDSVDKFFCSESLCRALKVREPWRFSPNALFDMLFSMYPQAE